VDHITLPVLDETGEHPVSSEVLEVERLAEGKPNPAPLARIR